jgi:uncharacterized tellurite resistance protein B-like protein
MRNWKKRLLSRLEAEPTQIEKERFERTHIATCVVLLEVAKYDSEFSSIEKDTIEAILKKEFSIPSDAIEDMMKIAEEKREDSVDLWEFTDAINQNFSREEKIKIIELAWKVIYADEKLDAYEDHYIHILAKLLRLQHQELIDAKLQVLYSGDSNDHEE